MALLTACYILMQRYTGQDDLVVSVSIADYTQKDEQGSGKCPVRTLALQSSLAEHLYFRELLEQVRDVSFATDPLTDQLYGQATENLGWQHDLRYPPVSNVIINVTDTSSTNSLSALIDSNTQMGASGIGCALALYAEMWESSLHLQLARQYLPFSSESIAHVLDQLQYLLEQIVVAPEMPIQQYSLITPAAAHVLPDAAAALPETPYELITTSFASWVQRSPQQVAVRQGQQAWTYQELAESAFAIARSLLAQGQKQSDVVAVMGQRSFGLIASMIAVFLSGGVLLPIDRGLPTHRQELMLQEARAKHLLYIGNRRPEDEWVQKRPGLVTLCIRSEANLGIEQNNTAQIVATQLPVVHLDDAAYIFFTSGTTGVPKGVLGSHKGLSHFLSWERTAFAVEAHDCCAQLTCLSFDVVLRDIFLPLSSGATLCLPEWSDEPGLDKVLLWLEREKISLLHTVPALAQSWLAHVPPTVTLRSLRWVFFAGEPLTDVLVQRWRAAFPAAGSIANFYGPTETSLAKCCSIVAAETISGIQPVGSPLPETQALVLTTNNRLCGIGEIGEIVLRTPFRSLGYINAPEEYRKRFIRNPFRNDDSDILYRTGDRGRYRPDGSLEILGRLDHQVKIHGVRVEPDEIMATLLLHPAVEACVVITSKNEQGHLSLVAYIVKQEPVTTAELKSYLSGRLPSPMLPSTFVYLDALPLTPNGKIDRKALPAPNFSHCSEEFVAATTPLQKRVAASWSQALGIEQIGIHENFFLMGGHSLLAMQVIAHLRSALQVELSLRSFFDAPTIALQADYIAQLRTDETAPCVLPAIRAVPREAYRQPISALPGENGIRKELSAGKSILPLFEEQVERTPDALAIVCAEQQMSYRQLNERANQLAHFLHQQGVGSEVMVGLCVERSLEMIVGLLGILKAGGVYVPLAPDAPAHRLNFQSEHTHMPLLLTQARLQAQLSPLEVPLVCLDRDWELIGQQSVHNPCWQVNGEQLAYVIYTSGSTGQPKGVLIEHQALLAHCQNMIAQYHLHPADCVLLFAAATFDASLEQTLPTLLVGAKLLLREEQLWSPDQLLQRVEQQRISVLSLPPAYWQQIAQAWSQLPVARATLSSLRLVILGGEQLPPEALRLWRHTPWGAVPVFNVYGPTEATITATLYDTSGFPHLASDQLRVPIGRPLPNRRIYLLDQTGQLVPVGVAGELHIGGESLARGYLKQAKLTAERFVPDPFSTQPGARLYKTGDLARWRADGTIEVLGRLDQQVKLRGFRIELGEIEAVLSLHPAVGEVAVLLHEKPGTEKLLVAYVVARAGEVLDPPSLRRYLQERLPAYMLPGSYVLLDALPWLPSGKLDRQALLRAELTRWTEEETFLAPQSPIQQQLVQIWEELVDARPIGIRDNFFYLGGHSLLAARLVDRIEHVFGKSIALSTLFAGPTIEQLAAVLEPQDVHEVAHHPLPDTIVSEEIADERASIFPIQAKGSKRPFFFLHGDWGGGAFYCFALARALGADQSFYVLAPYKFDGLQHLPSFEEVAATHIDAIRTIQSKGPYLLGGFCNGGLLAYEMARQLAAAGERVDFLALINPSQPMQFEKTRSVSKHVNKLFHLSERKQANLFLSGRHALRHVYRTLNPTGARVEDFDKLLDLDPRLKEMFPPVEALYSDYVGVFSWLASRYETGIYPGKITFYWASEEPCIEQSWLPVIAAKDRNAIERYIVPGTHMSCVTEHIHELAACLSTCLHRAQEEALIHTTKVAVRE